MILSQTTTNIRYSIQVYVNLLANVPNLMGIRGYFLTTGMMITLKPINSKPNIQLRKLEISLINDKTKLGLKPTTVERHMYWSSNLYTYINLVVFNTSFRVSLSRTGRTLEWRLSTCIRMMATSMTKIIIVQYLSWVIIKDDRIACELSNYWFFGRA